MIRLLYLTFLALSCVAFVGTILIAVGLLGPIDENSGNAGAFSAFGAGFVLLVGIHLLAFLGFVTWAITYVFYEFLPNKLLYRNYLPLIFCVPAALFYLYLLFKITVGAL
ncbi:hypothetical protein [Pseudoalteromonas sp. T1lg23B]|uniref:hypothetical protein n=1 Tax=Pseudoalteromonas sp. T1lg23B TaxID=2077097 RepID=UPI000CF705AC|nr:hypothetical protein [Pseudoalteromonas sp. T1lg23B]